MGIATSSKDRSSIVFYALVVASVVPILGVDYLPSMDLPQHAAQIQGLREYWSGNPDYTEVFRVNWFTPYLLAYLLVYAISSVVSVQLAINIVVAASVAAVPISLRWVMNKVGGEGSLAILSIPVAYGFAFDWGFLSFMASVPLAVLFFGLTIEHEKQFRPKLALGVAAFSVLLFFSHVVSLLLASLASLAYIAARTDRGFKNLVLTALPYTAALPFIVLWSLFMVSSEDVVRESTIIYPELSQRIAGLLIHHSGLAGLGDLPSIAMTVVLLALPAVAFKRITRDRKLLVAATAVTAVAVLSPTVAFGTAYISERLVMFAILFWLLLWRSPRESTLVALKAVPAVALVFLVVTFFRFKEFSDENHSFDLLMEHMEPDQKVLQLPVDWLAPGFINPVYMHFVNWYQAKKGGLVEYNFAYNYAMMLRYKDQAGPPFDDKFSWRVLKFDWDYHQGDRYRYFVVRAPVELKRRIFKERAEEVHLVHQSGWWWLYERDPNIRIGKN